MFFSRRRFNSRNKKFTKGGSLFSRSNLRESEVTDDTPYFKFYVLDKLKFSVPLKRVRCNYKTMSGERCNRHVYDGVPYCAEHLSSELHLEIRKSTVPNAGNGLFACLPDTTSRNELVFAANPTRKQKESGVRQRICEFEGEILNAEQLQERYGDFTAPYALKVTSNFFIDPAGYRSVGAMANHKVKKNMNAKLIKNNLKNIW